RNAVLGSQDSVDCQVPDSASSPRGPGSEANDLRHIVGNAVSIALVLLSFSTAFTYLRWRLRVSPHILIRLAERSIHCPARAGRDLPRPSQHYPPRRCRSGRAARRTGRRPALVRIRRPRTLPVHRRRRRRGGEQARTPGPHGLTDTSNRGIHRVHHAPGLGLSRLRLEAREPGSHESACRVIAATKRIASPRLRTQKPWFSSPLEPSRVLQTRPTPCLIRAVGGAAVAHLKVEEAVTVSVSMRVMSAADGYKYLLRTVAAADGDRSLSTPLTRYYAEAGNPPGRWLGSGVHTLGSGELHEGDEVSEA